MITRKWSIDNHKLQKKLRKSWKNSELNYKYFENLYKEQLEG